MIIVEGPDGGGKTHLARRLVEELDLTYKRYSGLSSTQGPTNEKIVDWWDAEIALNSPTSVYDRCYYISEVVYQLATPHRELIADGERMIRGIARLWTFEPLVIFCIPPWEAAVANVGQKERLEGVDDRALHKIWWAYHSLYAMYSNAAFEFTTLWDYTRQNEKLLFEHVKAYMKAVPA